MYEKRKVNQKLVWDKQFVERSDLVFVSLACNRKFLFEKVRFGPEKDRFVFTCLSEATFHACLRNFSCLSEATFHACQRQLFMLVRGKFSEQV